MFYGFWKVAVSNLFVNAKVGLLKMVRSKKSMVVSEYGE